MLNSNTLPLNNWLRLLGFLNLTFGHPVYLGASFMLCMALNLYTEVSSNVFLIYLLPFVGLLFLFALLRYGIFIYMHKQSAYAKQVILDKFIRINIWCMPGLFIFLMMLMPIEGNVFGSVFAPVIFIFGIVIGPLIFLRSRRSARDSLK